MRVKKLFGTLLVVGVLSVSAVQVLPAAAVTFGNEGCTPGFWKNHTDSWEEYTPASTLGNNFAIPTALSDFDDETFIDALNYGGGPGIVGGARILFRAGVAAYLNAAHDGLGYPLRRFQATVNGPALQTQINDALASLDRGTMLDLASYLDGLNNLGADYCG